MTGQLQDAGLGESTPARWDLFVSYVDDDRDWVDGFLLPGLQAAGVRYRDESQFVLGQPMDEQFAAAVERSDRVLLVISPAFLADGSAQRLRLLAQQYGQERSTWPVVPLLLHPVEKLPLSLGMLARLDATDERDWEECLERLLADLRRPLPTADEVPDCPYPGMAPYTRDRAAAFHGRDAEVQEIHQRLRTHPLLLVVGPSGSGKSSLLHAGVEPGLPARSYRVVSMRPGPRPLDELAAALAVGDDTDRLTTVLLIDQLEELFTVAARPGAGASGQVEGFCAEVLRLRDTGRVQVLLAVRADFYPQLMTSPLWDAVRDHRLEVLPLSGDRLLEAIALPAAQVNVHIESALLHAIVRDAAGQPGSLPLIQETLVLLWGHLRRRYLPLSAYDALVLPTSAYGEPPRTGLQVALALRADAAMAELHEGEERLVARRIFLRLVQLMDGRGDVRRRQRRRELAGLDSPPEVFDRVLQHLIDARLITCTTDERTSDSDEAFIDLAHEAIITGWPALRRWIAELRTAEDARRRLEAEAEEWVERGRGTDGLLGDVELPRAEAWLASPDAAELGRSARLVALVAASRSAIDASLARKSRVNRLFRVLTAALTVLLVAVAVVAVIAVQQRNEAQNGRELARSGELSLAAQRLLPNGLDTALLLSQEALAVRDTPLAREGLLAASSTNPRVVRMLHAPVDQPTAAVSPDGRSAVTGGIDGVVRVWDLDDGRPGRPLGTMDGEVRAVTVSADGAVVAATSKSGQVSQWDLATGEPVTWTDPGRGHSGDVRAVAYSQDGSLLATGGADGLVLLRQPATGQERHVLTGHRDWVDAVAFSPDGSLLVTAGGRTEHRSVDSRILVWDTGTGALVRELPGHTDAVRALSVSRDGLLASAGAEGLVKVWSLPEGALLHELVGHQERVFSVAFSPDGKRLASAGRDHTVRLWDPVAGAPVGPPMPGHFDSVRDVAFAGNDRLLSVGDGTRLFVWDVADGPRNRLGRVLPDQSETSRAMAVDARGELLATGDDSGRVVLRGARDGTPIGTEVDAGGPVSGIALGPDSMLVTATFTGEVRVWDDATDPGQPARRVLDEQSVAVAVSPDGRHVVTGGSGHIIRVWDAALQRVDELPAHDNWVRELRFRESDGALVSVGYDGRAFLWEDVPGGEPVRLTERSSAMDSLDVSPDGRTMATGNADGKVVLWDLGEREARERNRPAGGGHTGRVTAVAFDRTGERLVTADEMGTLRLWDVGPGLEFRGVLGALDSVEAVVATGDDALVSSGPSGPVGWTLDTGEWARRACALAGRNLDDAEARRYGFDRAPTTCGPP
jgi:WD40 repeat protein